MLMIIRQREPRPNRLSRPGEPAARQHEVGLVQTVLHLRRAAVPAARRVAVGRRPAEDGHGLGAVLQQPAGQLLQRPGRLPELAAGMEQGRVARPGLDRCAGRRQRRRGRRIHQRLDHAGRDCAGEEAGLEQLWWRGPVGRRAGHPERQLPRCCCQRAGLVNRAKQCQKESSLELVS